MLFNIHFQASSMCRFKLNHVPFEHTDLGCRNMVLDVEHFHRHKLRFDVSTEISLFIYIEYRRSGCVNTALGVGRIIVQYPAHLCSPFSTLTAIPIFPFYILYPTSTKNVREPPLNSNSTHIHFHILISRSIPNPDAIMSSNRADFYDHNGGTFNSVPILEGEIRHLPDLCLHAFSRQPLRARARTIGRSKGLFETNLTQLRSRKLVQGKRRYSSRKLEGLSW